MYTFIFNVSTLVLLKQYFFFLARMQFFYSSISLFFQRDLWA